MSIQQSITQPLSLLGILATQHPIIKKGQEIGSTQARLATLQKAQPQIKDYYNKAETAEEKATIGKARIAGAEKQTAEYQKLAELTGKEKNVENYVAAEVELAKTKDKVSREVSELAEEEVRAEAEELSRREAAESYEEEKQKENEYNEMTRRAKESLARKQNEALESMRKTNPEAVAAYETIYGKGGMR